MTHITLPNQSEPLSGAFVRELLERKRAPDRYTLRAHADGYAIFDRDQAGLRIATFHGGDSWPLASRLLRMLRDDAARGSEPPEDAA